MPKLLIPAVMTAVLATSVPAFAADNLSTSDAEALCGKLETQYRDLTPFKQGLPYWKNASMEAKKGEQACAGANKVEGAHDMQAAIADLYVKPDTL